MTGALIILAVTVVTGLVLWLTHRPDSAAAEGEHSPALPDSADGEPEVCCGLHEVCEKGLTKSGEPLYFDDEELDRFAGRDPETYSDEETEEFREVLYTLLPSDIYPWGQSLERRGVALPASLRDEWLMLVNG